MITATTLVAFALFHPFTHFSRSFRLPKDADSEGISAETKDGVLYLQVPKKAETIARNIEIKSGD